MEEYGVFTNTGLEGNIVVGAAGAAGVVARRSGTPLPSAARRRRAGRRRGRRPRRGRSCRPSGPSPPRACREGRSCRPRSPCVPLVAVPVLEFPRPDAALEEDLACPCRGTYRQNSTSRRNQTLILCHSVCRSEVCVVGLKSRSLVARVKRGGGAAALGMAADLGLAAEAADEDDLVQAVDVSHFSLSSRILSWAMRASSSRGYLATRSLSAARASGLRPSSMKLRPFLRWAAAALSPCG